MTFERSCARASVAVLIVLVVFGWLARPAAARNLADMSGAEIKVLQQRLTEAHCYAGPVDGQASETLKTAKKSCPDQEPVLRIETGMHVAPFKQLAADAQCHIAATASDDKTVRIWSMPEGRLIRTQRLPIGEAFLGTMSGVAVSPDGTLIAAGGFDAHAPIDMRGSVYLFDAATGTQIRRIGSYESVINRLAFSADGKRLAVALGGDISVLDVASGRELMADKDFRDSSYGVAFGPDGTLYATGQDGFLRRYGLDLQRNAKVATQTGRKPYAIAVAPAGDQIAIGYADAAAIDIFDTVTLRRITQLKNGRGAGALEAVAWSNDGTRIVAGGTVQAKYDGTGHYLLRSWYVNGRPAAPDASVAENAIISLVPCGASTLFAAFDLRFGLLARDNSVSILQKGHIFDARAKIGDAFTISPDATRVRFGLDYGNKNPVLFDLDAGTLVTAPAHTAGLVRANVDGLAVKDWFNRDKPLYRGKPLELRQYEIARSLAVRNDKTGFALGTESALRAYDADGKALWERIGPSVAWGVNLAASGDVIVVAYYDGTIRWQRWSDGRELLALFVDRPTRRWVAWTPSGYYMASPGGEDLIGWHVNRGWEQPADFFPASRFRARFNRPDVVQLVLQTLDEDAAVRRADAAARRHEETKPISAALPPVVTIQSPENGAAFSEGNVNLVYNLRSPSGLRIDKVDILIDGSATGAQAPGLSAEEAANGGQRRVKIGLPPHDVDVGLVARSGALVSEVAHVRLAYRGATPPADEAAALKPVLYALLVGVSNYQNDRLRLGYPAKDAEDFATALKAQTGGLYRDVQVKLLTDSAATSVAVKDGLLWLQKQMTSRDIAIVFLAGHGMTDAKNEFWFLAYEADPARLLSTSVSRHDIVDVLHDLPGKKVIFLDACHAGAVLNPDTRTRGVPVDVSSAVNDFATAESGLVAYAASTGREFSVESDAWQHGAFTKALLEGIGDGKADLNHKGKITTALLDAYLAERVKELTEGEQHPVMSRPDAVPDFPLALVR